MSRCFGSSVADPKPFDTDPDPAFHFDTDPDPAFQFDTRTDPDPYRFKEECTYNSTFYTSSLDFPCQ
jgi:hypothetical protein